MAINKNSNLYIITYTVVMVVIVGALLATLATLLKDKQATNVLNEQKTSIMKAFGEADASFEKLVTVGRIKADKFVPVADKAEEDAVFKLLDKRTELAKAKDNVPIFKMEKDGVAKFVLPIVGKGLWGDIWGYVALQQTEDNIVIIGIVMDHKGETPGLGAEITTETVQKAFEGKKLYDAEGKFAVRMQKGGAQNEHQVDAITGGTKTCDGVNEMLRTSIAKYEGFLKVAEAQAEADVTEVEAPAAEGDKTEQPAQENVEPKTEEE